MLSFEQRTDFRFAEPLRALSCLTLGLNPCRENRSYQLTAYVKDNKTGVVMPVEVKETAECDIFLLLLPFSLFDPPAQVEIAINDDLIDNIAIALRDEIVKHEQGALAIPEVTSAVVEKPAVEAGDDGLAKKLKALKDARDAGVLTEQEYQQKRAEFLKGL